MLLLLAFVEVEMRESRTPCPNEPIGECATGLVDIFHSTLDSYRQDSVGVGPLVFDDDERAMVVIASYVFDAPT